MKKYDESKTIAHIKRFIPGLEIKTLVVDKQTEKRILMPVEAQPGIKLLGKISFLVNHCGYVIIPVDKKEEAKKAAEAKKANEEKKKNSKKKFFKKSEE